MCHHPQPYVSHGCEMALSSQSGNKNMYCIKEKILKMLSIKPCMGWISEAPISPLFWIVNGVDINSCGSSWIISITRNKRSSLLQ